jgi:hypothetical protein
MIAHKHGHAPVENTADAPASWRAGEQRASVGAQRGWCAGDKGWSWLSIRPRPGPQITAGAPARACTGVILLLPAHAWLGALAVTCRPSPGQIQPNACITAGL